MELTTHFATVALDGLDFYPTFTQVGLISDPIYYKTENGYSDEELQNPNGLE
jgi:hypothetical protein